mmetsp:Transcript_34343/g.107663  ORF Transcript_34343/g.107663 Transcript_34343/m.107663 type:complete len:227 (+) Transcript_34343:150-830(+)
MQKKLVHDGAADRSLHGHRQHVIGRSEHARAERYRQPPPDPLLCPRLHLLRCLSGFTLLLDGKEGDFAEVPQEPPSGHVVRFGHGLNNDVESLDGENTFSLLLLLAPLCAELAILLQDGSADVVGEERLGEEEEVLLQEGEVNQDVVRGDLGSGSIVQQLLADFDLFSDVLVAIARGDEHVQIRSLLLGAHPVRKVEDERRMRVLVPWETAAVPFPRKVEGGGQLC